MEKVVYDMSEMWDNTPRTRVGVDTAIPIMLEDMTPVRSENLGSTKSDLRNTIEWVLIIAGVISIIISSCVFIHKLCDTPENRAARENQIMRQEIAQKKIFLENERLKKELDDINRRLNK